MSELAQIIARILRQYEGADVDKIAMEIAEATRAVNRRAPEAGQPDKSAEQIIPKFDGYSIEEIENDKADLYNYGLNIIAEMAKYIRESIRPPEHYDDIAVNKVVVGFTPRTTQMSIETQAQADPVAWRWHWKGGDEPDVWGYSEVEICSDDRRHCEPLYTQPQRSAIPHKPGWVQIDHVSDGENARLKVTGKAEDVLRYAVPDSILRAAKAVDNHWNEFGPEHGFDECMHYLHEALAAAPEQQEDQ